MALFLDVFGVEHPVYAAHKPAWLRDERRHYGGDAVLSELRQWKGEADEHYTGTRQAMASYLNFAQLHASTLAGHLARQAPPINYGSLGEVRTREQIDVPTLAELFDYNCDGIGTDGMSLRAYLDGVQERAEVTGLRYVMVEMPNTAALQTLRISKGRPAGGPVVTLQDQLDGFHPYLVEFSPLAAPNWRRTNGVLQWIVLRVPISPALDLVTPAAVPGYYVLVRKGYTGLGAGFEEGGWWLYDGERNAAADHHAVWDDTEGQIPLDALVAESSSGTFERPALARSLTMELGQLSVGLMNLRSTRDFNLIQAGKSVNYILGGDSTTHELVTRQHEDGSIVVTVPPVMFQDGKVGIPTIWNSSEASVATAAFKDVIEGTMAEAREIMVRQVTSTPASSGVSKETGFAEATSPLLARLAANRESFENTVLPWVAMRFGKQPDQSVVWPRDFKIRDVLTDIDAMLDSIRRSGLSSPTWEQHLLLQKGDQLGLVPDDAVVPAIAGEPQTVRDKIAQELADAVQQKKDQAAQMQAAFGLGSPADPNAVAA